jgi:hypothetical protein
MIQHTVSMLYFSTLALTFQIEGAAFNPTMLSRMFAPKLNHKFQMVWIRLGIAILFSAYIEP